MLIRVKRIQQERLIVARIRIRQAAIGGDSC